MNNSSIFKILYYICFCLFLVGWFGLLVVFFNEEMIFNIILGIVNIVFTIIFIVKSINKKLMNVNILFPIAYLVFMLSVIVLMFVMNNKVVFPYMHFNYYGIFILFDFLLLNLYSVLCCYKGKSK